MKSLVKNRLYSSRTKTERKILTLKFNRLCNEQKIFLFKYSLDSHEQRTVEDLKLKQ